MTRTAIPVILPTVNGATEIDLYAAGVSLANNPPGFLFTNPGGRTVLLAILDAQTDVTITIKAVADPFGRGGSGDDDKVFTLSIGAGSRVAYLLHRYSPAGFNQSSVSEQRQVEVDVSGLGGVVGTGKLVALSL